MKPAIFYSPICLEHETGRHPENPGRLQAVQAHLRECGLWERLPRPEVQPPADQLLLQVHEEPYLEGLRRLCEQGGGYLTADTPLGPRSWDAAVHACGAAIAAVDYTLKEDSGAGFALVRPPGHHAGPGYGMGFCLLNHAAAAARHALSYEGVRRVLLVDFDVHHGNGTQDIFWRDPDVFYLSMHQSPAYPGTGASSERGAGPGEGATSNLPLPPGSDDEDHFRALASALPRVAEEWAPDLILCSAGYDSHWTNAAYVSGIRMNVTVAGIARWIELVRDVAVERCGGRLALTLEGGYHPPALASSVEATLRVLLDEPAEDPIGPPSR